MVRSEPAVPLVWFAPNKEASPRTMSANQRTEPLSESNPALSSFASSCSVKGRLSRFVVGGMSAAWLACEVEFCECGCEFCVWFAEKGRLCLVSLACLWVPCEASSADVDCDDEDWLACDLVRLGVG